MNEEQFIPFHTTDLAGTRVLVLAPHPDDETIGCGGTLALHAAAGDPVRVLILTNGEKGDVFGRFDRNAYIAIRQQETRSACASLGISDVMFWPYEDHSIRIIAQQRILSRQL
ncbi:MAG: PIG-L family deacetylase [Deltaproteobacteria bacterium]|nr:PIG-L family deacetylase [Deltaproteobacteria bacterium]